MYTSGSVDTLIFRTYIRLGRYRGSHLLGPDKRKLTIEAVLGVLIALLLACTNPSDHPFYEDLFKDTTPLIKHCIGYCLRIPKPSGVLPLKGIFCLLCLLCALVYVIHSVLTWAAVHVPRFGT